MGVAIFALLYLPASPVDGGRSLLIPVLNSRDAQILASRILADDPKKAFSRDAKITVVDVKDTLVDWRLWGHCAAAFLSSWVSYPRSPTKGIADFVYSIILTPINTYGPKLIQSLGYSGFTAVRLFTFNKCKIRTKILVERYGRPCLRHWSRLLCISRLEL